MITDGIVIFGTGGFARELHQILEDLRDAGSAIPFLGFLDGNPKSHGGEVHGHPVLGGVEWLRSRPNVAVAIGIGSPSAKRNVVDQIRALGPRSFPPIIHPRAWLGNRIQIGEGAIICAGTNATTDLKIGAFVILNLDCTVGHDAVIGDFTTAAPSVNLSGNVLVGEGCDLGTGSTIIQGITIGHWSIVGAGAVVVRDLPANVTAVGTPARPIKERAEGWQKA